MDLNFKSNCIENAEEFLDVADKLKDTLHQNVRYHLLVLAMEELGKVALYDLKSAQVNLNTEPSLYGVNGLDDHVKKLYWAIWAPLLGKGIIKKSEIQELRGLAKSIHSLRLAGLYVEEGQPLPSQLVSKDEANRLEELVKARIEWEKTTKRVVRTDEEIRILQWFINATDESFYRTQIFSKESLNKLETLKDTYKWIEWLYGEFKKQEADMEALVKKDLNVTSQDNLFKDKWEFKIRLYSDSHSFRQKDLNKLKDLIPFIDMTVVTSKKSKELILKITLKDDVHPQQLWNIGYGISKKFVAALNISLGGFIWWSLPKDVSRFFEELSNIPQNVNVELDRSPKLKIGWGNLVLKEDDIRVIVAVFAFIMNCKENFKEAEDSYVVGIALLAKSDIHLQFETQIFMQFFNAFKFLLDAKENNEVIDLAKKKLAPYLPNTESLEQIVKIALEVDLKPDRPPLTLTEVIAMKMYCDLLFKILAKDFRPTKPKKDD